MNDLFEKLRMEDGPLATCNHSPRLSYLTFRIIPTAAHTLTDVEETLQAFSFLKTKLDSGFYRKEELVAVTKDS